LGLNTLVLNEREESKFEANSTSIREEFSWWAND